MLVSHLAMVLIPRTTKRSAPGRSNARRCSRPPSGTHLMIGFEGVEGERLGGLVVVRERKERKKEEEKKREKERGEKDEELVGRWVAVGVRLETGG